MRIWIDLVHRFAWSPASLAVQIKTLDKNTVIAETSDPYVTFSIQTQLDAFTNVQSNHTKHVEKSSYLGLMHKQQQQQQHSSSYLSIILTDIGRIYN